MSSSLAWQIMRKNNAFIVQKRGGDGVRFSREAGNIVNKHSFKYSGIANEQAITIDAHEVNDKEFGVSLGIKTRAARKSPKKSTSTVGLTGGARKTMRSIKGYTTTTHYRKDLEKVALARASKILLAQKPKKQKERKMNGRRGLRARRS